jgi:hypothetical protein
MTRSGHVVSYLRNYHQGLKSPCYQDDKKEEIVEAGDKDIVRESINRYIAKTSFLKGFEGLNN